MKFIVAKLFILKNNFVKAKEYLKPVYITYKKIYGDESMIVQAIKKLITFDDQPEN